MADQGHECGAACPSPLPDAAPGAGIGGGYVQIYTGNGKGKTTAALGLALRAAGRALRTHMVQFMKGQRYGELDGASMLNGLLTIEQFGSPEFCNFGDEPDPRDVKRAEAALERVHALMESRACDILVADEMITACHFRLIAENDVLDAIAQRPHGMELVLTGRGATPRMIRAADLVTEMLDIKHYMDTESILGREGIEC